METYLRVLSDTEKDQIHEKSVKILAETGVRIETELGRSILKKAIKALQTDIQEQRLFPVN